MLAQPWQCKTLNIEGARCVEVPTGAGLNAQVEIEIEGRAAAVPRPATCRQALTQAGVHNVDAVLRTLRVFRPYGGHMAEVIATGSKRDLLSLTLSGNERLTW